MSDPTPPNQEVPNPNANAVSDLLKSGITRHLIAIREFIKASLPGTPFAITFVARGPTPDLTIILSQEDDIKDLTYLFLTYELERNGPAIKPPTPE